MVDLHLWMNPHGSGAKNDVLRVKGVFQPAFASQLEKLVVDRKTAEQAAEDNLVNGVTNMLTTLAGGM